MNAKLVLFENCALTVVSDARANVAVPVRLAVMLFAKKLRLLSRKTNVPQTLPLVADNTVEYVCANAHAGTPQTKATLFALAEPITSPYN